MDCKGMENVMVLNWVAVIICLSVRESCTMCVPGNNELVEGVLGDNANISCKAPLRCDYSLFDRKYSRSTMSSSLEATTQTFSYESGDGLGEESFSNLAPLTFDDFGIHSCWCYRNNTKYGNSPVCTVTLSPICQSEVKVNGKTILYNSSQMSSSVPRFLNVTEGDKVKFKCPEKAAVETNCHKMKEVNRKDSGHSKYKLTISLRHNLCSIVCNLNHKGRQFCNINITLHASELNEATEIPSGPTEFPMGILVSIMAVFLVTVILTFCFIKFFLRWRSKSRSNKQRKPCYHSSSSSHHGDQNYETINLSSKTVLQEHVHSLEQGACATDGFYYDIEDTKNCHDIIDTEDPLHQPANSLTDETLVSHDFNFVIQAPKEKNVKNHESHRCDEFHFKATIEEWVKGEDVCDPIIKMAHQQGRLTNSSRDGAGELEVFYAVLENEQEY